MNVEHAEQDVPFGDVEEAVRAALREQAEGSVAAAPGLADRVLAVRDRRRKLRYAGVAAAVILAVGAAVGVRVLPDSGGGASHGSGPANSRLPVNAHPDQSPPRDMISAGNTVVVAWATSKQVKQPNHDVVTERTYSVLDSRTGRYVADPRWAYLAVAPGLRTAAVLEGELPAHRIGLLDLETGKVARWIPLPQGAGAVAFSPDGTKLVATTYAKDPDRAFWSHRTMVGFENQPTHLEPQLVPSRSGFAVVEVASGVSHWHALPPYGSGGPMPSPGPALAFDNHGTLLYAPITYKPWHDCFDLDGKQVPDPAKERAVDLGTGPAGLSPNGDLAAGGYIGSTHVTATEVLDPRTGHRVARLPGQRLLAWADDKHLIAWDLAPGGNLFDDRLVLIPVSGGKETVLSGTRHRKNDSPGPWDPVFATR